MLFSHRFGSVETLSRATFWLSHHGFEVVPAAGPAHDDSRLTLKVDFSKAAAALALIDSIERSDPDGWPGDATRSRSFRGHRGHAAASPAGAKPSTPIHWHSREESSPADAVSVKVREYMFSRWE